MPIALKDLSLNSRLDKLEDELRVMLLFSSMGKDKCQDGHVSCDSNLFQECKCLESPKQIEEPKMSAKNLRSRSAPEKRRKKRYSSDSRDQGSPKKELDKILQIFQENHEKEKKKKRHCICESSNSDCCKENKKPKANLQPIDIRTPPRKARTKKKHCENKVKRPRSASQTDSVSLEIPNESIHTDLCCCHCDTSKEGIAKNCSKRTIDLEIEVTTLRKEIDVISKSKHEADILRHKYDELHCCKMQFELELQHLKKENQALAENLQTEKNTRIAKMEEVQSESKIIIERIRSEEDKLVKDLETKNDMIRRLSKATDDLTITIHEKEKENCAMSCKIKEIETTTKLASQKINMLKDTNRQLAKSVMSKHHSLQNCQSKTCKFKREVKEYKARVEQSLQEIQRLQDKNKPHACECGKRSPRTKVFCQEAEDTNTVKELVNKISSLENIQLQNIAKIARKNKVLQSGFDNLYQLMTCGDSARKNTCCNCEELKDKCQELREKTQELKKEIKCLKSKDKQYANEREELKSIIEELTMLVKKQKERLQEFLDLNDKQAQMLVAQEAVITSHNEQNTLMEMENQIIKKKCNDLEKDIKETKEIVCSPLKKQLEQFRLTLAEDQDSLKIKEKIIEDQANTIIDLKKKLQANSGVTMNIMNQGLSQQQELKQARQESDEKIRKIEYENSVLKEDLLQMRDSKTKLQAQIAAIDTHLVRDYRAQADQLEHQKQTIADLRQQMALHTEEHELQMDVLMKDMNSAKMTARYATQKLEETLRDFQNQTNNQMQVRDVLTGMLREKDCKLKSAIVKMSSLTFDPTSVASAISRQKQPTHLQELNQFLNSSSESIHSATTKGLATQPHASDFQQQLRCLVPSELYTNTTWGSKKVKAVKDEDDDDEVDNEQGQVAIENKGKIDACCHKRVCFPEEDLYCSGTSGNSSSSGVISNGEEEYKKGSKNIYISPYIEDDDPTYIYVPIFRPTPGVSPCEPLQKNVTDESTKHNSNVKTVASKVNNSYCHTNQKKILCDANKNNAADNGQIIKCKCPRKDVCFCDFS